MPRGLVCVVPSRGRPENIKRLIEAMDETCRADTILHVGVDADDPCLAQYNAVILEAMERHKDERPRAHGPYITYTTAEDLRFVVPWINHLAVPAAREHVAYAIGHFGDDNLPRTEGWDVRVLESLRRHQFCFADDLYPGRVTGTLCCHIFMRAEVVRLLGYMGPPAITHMYVDPVWMAWGRATSIEFLSDVILEHMHYSASKSRNDDTYRASFAKTQGDLQAFNAYCRDPNGLNADVTRIRDGAQTFSLDELDDFRTELNIPY